MSDEVKKIMEEQSEQKKKPLAIMDHLIQQKLPLPKMYQLKNDLAKHKMLKFGPATISMADLGNLLKRFEEVPEEPYVTVRRI